MSDIFISYKREDVELARSLAKKLSQRGWNVWWDHDIPVGLDYDEVIVKELDSARCVLVLWSSLSVNSRNVKDEANVALERNVLIPIFIGKDIKPPLGFRMVQGMIWNEGRTIEKNEWKELLKHIKRLLGESPIVPPEDDEDNHDIPKPPSHEEMREKELLMNQNKLSDFLSRKEITPDVFSKSLILLVKKDSEFSHLELILKSNLDALLNNSVPPVAFMEKWKLIMNAIPKINPDPIKPVTPDPPKIKFCIGCGNVLKPTQTFCVKCGRKVS